MDMTAVAITAMVCVTLIILNIIWIFKAKADTKKIEAENREKELKKALRNHPPTK